MWNISRLSRYFDAFIAATSACSWLKRPFRRCKVDYCYSTFDLHRQHRRSSLHRNRANSHTLRTKNLNSSYQGRKIKMKLADITMKGRSDTLRQIDGSLSVHDCCSRYFKLWNLASDLTTNARPVLSLLTGKDSVTCLWSVMLESKPSAEESLISIMISYYWSNVDNGFQTNASSFLAAA